MDDLLIKTNPARDGGAPKTGGAEPMTALAGLAVSFNDLLHKAGIRIESGFHAIAGIGAAANRGEPAAPADDYRRQPDDGKERTDVRDRSDGNRQDLTRARQAERPNDSGRDHGAEHRDARGDARDGGHAHDQANDRAADKGNNGAANRDSRAVDDRGGERKSTAAEGGADKATAESKNPGGETKTATAPPSGEQSTSVNAVGAAAVANAALVAETLNPVLAGLLAGGQAQDAAEGPAKAIEAVSATGTENMAQTATRNNLQGQAQAFANANAQAKTMAAGQSVHNAEGDGKSATAKVETQAANVGQAIDAGDAAGKPAETQAASLARMFGDGNRAQVNVSVADEARYLMSRPTATLAANTALSGETQGQASSGQSANSHVQGGNQNPTAAAQAQQTQAGPTQTQGGQNAQAQGAALLGGPAKGLAQAASASGNAGGTAHAGGGGEAGALTNTNASPGAQQAQQQSAANPANKPEQPVRGGHTVLEQVSVKIAKAINAGNDRITIQLRPANMGRVEVKMELTHDNRLMAVVTADNKDTLELLQRDARDLQRALANAGLHAGDGDLQFNLRGQTGQGTDGDGKSAGARTAAEESADAGTAALDQAMFPPEGGIFANGRIDIRA